LAERDLLDLHMALTRFSVPPLHEVTRDLAAVAMGSQAPDLVIRNARVLSTYSDRLFAEREVWLRHGRIAAVRPAGKLTLKRAAREYDAGGGILAPGLVDPHIHIESSMVTACAYAEAALLNGTTTIFCDSHEIGNVLGEDGVAMMLEDARQAPLSIFLTVPSTVPATHAGLETAGGDLTPEKVGAIFDKWPEAAALGEKMDFVPVALGDPRSHAIIAEALKRGRPVCGHVYGREFVAAYAASGVTDTHESIDRDIANDFCEAGIWVFLRGGPPGSPWDSLPAAIEAITKYGASPKRFCLCTDDRDAADLLHFGLDYVARTAVKCGMPREVAWSMGSLHAATRYAMDGEIGALGHSRRADMVLLNDDLEVQNTWYGGELVVEGRKITHVLDAALSKRYRYPQRAVQTVKLPADYRLLPEIPANASKAHVIALTPAGIVTGHEILDLKPGVKLAELMNAEKLVYLTVLERHGLTGGCGYGLLKGFGLTDGAVASTIGHDAHNLIVAGTNEGDMRLAVETLRKNQGGIIITRGGQVLAFIALPVAGLLSEERVTVVAEQTRKFHEQWNALGCTLPYMGFNLLPLSVIPEVRLTDKGLVLVPQMEIAPLFE
jgi:adenine deaminase